MIEVKKVNKSFTLFNQNNAKITVFKNLNFEPGDSEENVINLRDISSTVAYILGLSRNTIVDEINLSPSKKAVKFK
jgi:alpha-D-ribose 1-methylphosphonate 5-triphosphate synthase subunit PhnL